MHTAQGLGFRVYYLPALFSLNSAQVASSTSGAAVQCCALGWPVRPESGSEGEPWQRFRRPAPPRAFLQVGNYYVGSRVVGSSEWNRKWNLVGKYCADSILYSQLQTSKSFIVRS